MLPKSAISFMASSSAKWLSGDKILRYLFDLTTTAQWRGPAVGIVRVEQELARRARRDLGLDVAFCLYDRAQAAVVAIDDDLAENLIEGRIRIDFQQRRASRGHETSLRRKARSMLLGNATVYYLFQRARGRSLTRAEILKIRDQELAAGRAQLSNERAMISGPNDMETVSLAALPHRYAHLDADTMIISGGLDWQYKNLRALWDLKQAHRFSYCAVVYDLIAVHFPQFVVPGYVELLTDYFGELLWLADQTMCISHTTKSDWIRHASDVGAEPVASSVFPLGCDLSPRVSESSIDLPTALNGKRFALYVSTIEPRKNHFMLYQAWEECLRTKQIDPSHDRLVFVGRQGWATEDLLHEIKTNPLTKETIIILHDLTDQQLASLYRACAFVLFPSLYEGFGLPLAEALGYGKPCVASDSGALSEIGDDLVMRVDPKDTLEWSRAITRVMSGSSDLGAWEDRIKHDHRPITWDDAAKIFFETIAASVRNDVRSFGDEIGAHDPQLGGPAERQVSAPLRSR